MLFGSGKCSGRALRSMRDTFSKLWPGVFAAIQNVKCEFGYKVVSQLLQRLESTIIIERACGRVVAELPGIRFLTIHDAALVVSGQAEQVQAIIEAEFQRYGVEATVRRKNLRA